MATVSPSALDYVIYTGKLALTGWEPEKSKTEVPIELVSGEGVCEGASYFLFM